jgi:hypothetical protein
MSTYQRRSVCYREIIIFQNRVVVIINPPFIELNASGKVNSN